ncbi:MAG: helix-turn-helix transcriptional regulator [Clostridia bacterium]|nr:helix-turn-helix transcriptional regulator [Clostridia bacterium]
MANVKNIGSVIAELRKKKGVTQEGLAKAVGISAQAVSKWENGGVPDVELLPEIADFFKISVDELLGRSAINVNITTAILDYVRTTKPDSEERFRAVFDLCWDIERSIFDFCSEVNEEVVAETTVKDYETINKPDGQQNSCVLTDYGFTQMGIANRLQYFMCVPELKDKQKSLFDNVDYTAFFGALSDKDVFRAFVFLFSRDAKKAFTEHLLMKELHVPAEKAQEIVRILTKYQMIRTTQLELDDEIKDVYNLIPQPTFVGLLIFAREMVDPTHRFAYYSDNRSKPLLA